MAVTVEQIMTSGAGEGKGVDVLGSLTLVSESRTLNYRVHGAETTANALLAALEEAPLTLDGLVRGVASVEPELVDTAGGVYRWIAEVPYSRSGASSAEDQAPEPPVVGETVVTYSIGGESLCMRRARSQTRYNRDEGKKSPDFGNLINVTPDGAVEGVQIMRPQLTVNVTRTYTSGAPSLPALEDLVFTVNTNAITLTDSQTGMSISAAPGEAMMMGVEGGRGQVDGTFQLAIRIGIRRNETAISADGIPVGNVKGWEYVWLYCPPTKDASSNSLAPRSKGAYKAQLYPETAWSL